MMAPRSAASPSVQLEEPPALLQKIFSLSGRRNVQVLDQLDRRAALSEVSGGASLP